MVPVSEYAPSCELTVPGRLPEHGAGWYLVASNARVEVGPFLTREHAERAAEWLDDEGRGVNPGPWVAVWSRSGLIIGSRWRNRPLALDAVAG